MDTEEYIEELERENTDLIHTDNTWTYNQQDIINPYEITPIGPDDPNTSFDKRTGTYTVIGASRYSGATRGRMITSFNNWLLGHWSSGTESYYAEGTIKLTGSSPNDTNWRIYAGTGDSVGDIWNFYINGNFVIGNNGGSQGPYGIQIGTHDFFADGSTGQFSFLQFYNRVLSASEIRQNYDALKGRFNL
jgi:hypothetical protein